MEQHYEPSVPIDTLEDHPDNPRDGDEATVLASIEEHGFYGAVVAQVSTRRIIAGHNRRRQARTAGLTHVPVLWLDVDDDEALRLMLIDNRSNDKADYHDDVLAQLLEQLAATERGLIGTGYQPEDLSDLLAMLNVPTLDDLADQHGDLDPNDLWPVLRFKVPPTLRDRYLALVEHVPGGDADQFAWLVEHAARTTTP